VHTVAAGETLSGIAQDHGVDVQALLAMNPRITDRALIHPGEQIVISPVDLGTVGGPDFNPVAMNDSGQIVGTSDPGSGESDPVMWQDGVLIDLATGGAQFSPVAINDRAQIAGTVSTSDGEHVALWQDGVLTDLGMLAGDPSAGIEVNNRGQVLAGGFLWRDGVRTDLSTAPGLAGRDFYPMGAERPR
jgi:probable HAF family extracellular repeat protein